MANHCKSYMSLEVRTATVKTNISSVCTSLFLFSPNCLHVGDRHFLIPSHPPPPWPAHSYASRNTLIISLLFFIYLQRASPLMTAAVILLTTVTRVNSKLWLFIFFVSICFSVPLFFSIFLSISLSLY